ncbi:MAG: hypothetical protein KA472_13605 [Pseudomonadales bacterium]|nr:hypothetical protein [Pseudomonadales bacterium]
MMHADIAIIPIKAEPAFNPGKLPPPGWIVKSENRLTMKMSIGLPVIASPIPSYLPVINQGVNGFLAQSPREWRSLLDQLRDPDLRGAMGAKARASPLWR